MSAQDNLSKIQFVHVDSGSEHGLKAIHGERKVGEMYWNKASGTKWGQPFSAGQVSDIRVDEDYQHQGIATALWREGHKYEPAPRHSDVQTPAGSSWAEKVGD